MVRPAGFEPAAPGFEGRCSIQLSYERIVGVTAEEEQVEVAFSSIIRHRFFHRDVKR